MAAWPGAAYALQLGRHGQMHAHLQTKTCSSCRKGRYRYICCCEAPLVATLDPLLCTETHQQLLCSLRSCGRVSLKHRALILLKNSHLGSFLVKGALLHGITYWHTGRLMVLTTLCRLCCCDRMGRRQVLLSLLAQENVSARLGFTQPVAVRTPGLQGPALLSAIAVVSCVGRSWHL